MTFYDYDPGSTADWFNQRLADGGPVYMETQPGRFLAEPWNAVSSLLMLIPALFWLARIKNDPGRHRFMIYTIILIILGGTGSALFHGFRASVVFLIMDVLPSALLTLSLSIYFWLKVLKKWWHLLFIMVPIFSLRFAFWGQLPEHAAINLSYFVSGLTIGLPLILFLLRTRFLGWIPVAAAIASFAAALLFRQTDTVPIDFLPMGTHFLWHAFSAVGAFFILKYLYILIHPKQEKIHHGPVPA